MSSASPTSPASGRRSRRAAAGRPRAPADSGATAPAITPRTPIPSPRIGAERAKRQRCVCSWRERRERLDRSSCRRWSGAVTRSSARRGRRPRYGVRSWPRSIRHGWSTGPPGAVKRYMPPTTPPAEAMAEQQEIGRKIQSGEIASEWATGAFPISPQADPQTLATARRIPTRTRGQHTNGSGRRGRTLRPHHHRTQTLDSVRAASPYSWMRPPSRSCLRTRLPRAGRGSESRCGSGVLRSRPRWGLALL